MSYSMKPLGCDPQHVKGMSEKLIVSHYENNYGGAVKRLNLITEQLAGLDFNTAPGFLVNGLKREELIASNSMILHELFFDGLGEESAPGKPLEAAIARDFSSVARWRAEFIAMGKALGGGSGWVLLSWSPRDRRLVNQWAADHCHTLAGGRPILALDMYEHSYHIDYGASSAREGDLKRSNRQGSNNVWTAGALTRCIDPQPRQMEVNMRPKLMLAALLVGAASLPIAMPQVVAQTATLDTAAIERATGLKGAMIAEENVFKVTKPRTDVKIQVDQWMMPPFMGLGSWAAFTPAHGGKLVMMMGDTVVFEDEVNPAMTAAFEAGLEVTALHNHFFFDEPKVYFMHIGGTGEATKLAAGVKKVYDKIAEIRAANPAPGKAFTGTIASPSSINATPLEAALGVKGRTNQGMFKIVIGRPATMHGVSVGKEMGINTWASFGGSDDAAVIDGDFAMLENELQPVLRAMRKEGINIVAIHQHMSHEQPRYLFLHYWGKGKAADLARSLKRVLDTQAAVKS